MSDDSGNTTTLNRKLPFRERIRESAYVRSLSTASTVSLILFLLIVVLALLGPAISPYDVSEASLSERNEPPSFSRPFGTDNLGRDQLTRVLVGTRVSLFVAIGGALAAGFIGLLLGAISGYYGGVFDQIFLRVSEIFMAFPAIVLLLVFVSVLGPNMWNVIVIFAFTKWPRLYRLVRANFYSLREEGYVEALKALDVGSLSIIFRHLLLNTMGTVTVWFTLATATGIIQEAGLSFLGLGVQLPTPSLGNLLATARDLRVLQQFPWQWLFPGAFIGLSTMCVNFIGDWLRDVSDPRGAK